MLIILKAYSMSIEMFETFFRFLRLLISIYHKKAYSSGKV